MGLFSENKNKYFIVIQNLINNMFNENYTEKDITRFLLNHGFTELDSDFESALLNKSIKTWEKGSNNYYILKNQGNSYVPAVKSSVPIRPSLIELQWLKHILEDEKFALFIDKTTREELDEKLNHIKSAFKREFWDIKNSDSFGDDFANPKYVNIFSLLMRAIREKKMIRYTYLSKREELYEHKEAYPFRLEYSLKNNKFRLSIMPTDIERPIKMNILQLQHVELLNDENTDIKKLILEKLAKKKIDKPLLLEINNKRSTLERCFSLFSYYEKEASYNQKNNKYFMKLYYYKFDELEIIRDILSLGSSVLVIEPDHVRAEIIRRIKLQLEVKDKH